MTTYKALQVTESGEIEYHPAYPVEPEQTGNSELTDAKIDNWQQACKEAESGFLPVKNKEYAFKYIIDNKFNHIGIVIPGIYPYNGEVRYEFINPCIEKRDCQLTGEEYRRACSDVCKRTYRVAILVEPNTPEKPDSSETDWKKEFDLLDKEHQIIRQSFHELRASNDKLQKFKEYVHDRLDKMGIPENPEPDNNAAHGCRIEGRLNAIEQLRASNKELVEAVNDVLKYDYDHLLDHGVSAITAHLSSRLRKLIK
jgi:hypothetical protein